jgi:hypothetical protein
MESCLIWNLIPTLCFWTDSSCIQPIFVLLKLSQKTWSHFKVRAPRVDVFKSLKQTPFVASHQERCDNEASSILRLAWLNQNALMVVYCLFHELIYFLGYFLSSIKESLFFVVLPIQGKVKHSNCFPKVSELCAGSVYNSGYFICNNKFQVLKASRH